MMEQSPVPGATPTPAPTPVSGGRQGKFWRIILLATCLLVLPTSGFFWLLYSPNASQQLAAWLGQISQQRLFIKGLHGPLTGPLHIDQLRWQDQKITLELDNLQLDWSWQALLQNRLHIKNLNVKKLSMSWVASDVPLKAPASLALPVALSLEKLHITELQLQQQQVAEQLTASLYSDRKQHRLTLINAQRQSFTLKGAAQLDGLAPFQLHGKFSLQSEFQETQHPLPFLSLALSGSLEQLIVKLNTLPQAHAELQSTKPQTSSNDGHSNNRHADNTALSPTDRQASQNRPGSELHGQAQLELDLFTPQLLTRAQVQLQHIDLSRWFKDAPLTRMEVHADLQPQTLNRDTPDSPGSPEFNLSGAIDIRNHAAAAHDKNRLPLSHLRAHLHWQAREVQLTALELELPGQARLSGMAQWKNAQVQLELQARHLDLQQMHSRLQTTRLQGVLRAEINAQQQHLQLDFSQSPGRGLADLRLQAQIQGDTQRLRLQPLVIRQGKARLELRGELQRLANEEFKLSGQLQAFDPAQLIRLAPGRLNARIELSGQLKPQTRLQANWILQDSQWGGQSLSGQAGFKLIGPRVPHAELQLQLADNQLQLQGAWGKPGDHLDFRLHMPQLAALDRLSGSSHGITGAIRASGQLTGSSQETRIQLQIDSPYFNWPEYFSWRKLQVASTLGTAATAPLQLDLHLQELMPANPADSEPPGLRQLQLSMQGQTNKHHVQLQTRLQKVPRAYRARGADEKKETTTSASTRLHLALSGGWQAGLKHWQAGWQGELSQLQLQSAATEHNFVLLSPTPLKLARNHWQLGRARVNFVQLDSQLELEAQASQQQLQAQLQLQGSRLGSLQAQLSSGLKTAWSLDTQAPWSGQAQIQINDLQTLTKLLGAEWQTDIQTQGQLDGHLRLSGRPAAPEIHGRLQGKQLGLYWPDSGMHLKQGQLRAEFDAQGLHLQQLEFLSALQTPPRALQQAVGKERKALQALIQQPGQLRMQGELRYAMLANSWASKAIIDASASKAAQHDGGWLDIELDRLGVWQRSDSWLLISGRSRLELQDRSLQLGGQLKADTAYWQLNGTGVPRLSSDVIIHRKHAGSEQLAANPRWPWNLALTLDLGDKAYFNGFGLSSRLVGQLDIKDQGSGSPRAAGTIQSVDGRYTAYGQKLDIERGILRFDGLLENPGLDIRAVRHGLDVEAGVQVSGNVHQPRIQLISSPERPDSEKLSWLILGHGSEQLGPADAATLLSAASDLLGNDKVGLLQQLRSNFGLDEIDIRQGRLDSNGRPATSQIATLGNNNPLQDDQQILSLSKRLSSTLLISYEQVLGQAASLVKLTLELGRHLALIGRTGSDNALDLLYTLQFGQSSAPVRPAGPMGQSAVKKPAKMP